eukprot:jgi/Orpsp1_1/1185774/evm.model.c7180000095188.1
MANIADKINSISQESNHNEIKVQFEEDVYKIATNGKNKFNIESTLIFYSEKGTIFDFQNTSKNEISFNFNSSENGTVIIRNITFKDYYSTFDSGSILVFTHLGDTSDFKIIFENCVFENIQSSSLNFLFSCTKSVQDTPQVILNNCKF